MGKIDVYDTQKHGSNHGLTKWHTVYHWVICRKLGQSHTIQAVHGSNPVILSHVILILCGNLWPSQGCTWTHCFDHHVTLTVLSVHFRLFLCTRIRGLYTASVCFKLLWNPDKTIPFITNLHHSLYEAIPGPISQCSFPWILHYSYILWPSLGQIWTTVTVS